MKNTFNTGLLGESLACRYLKEEGFSIEERNYRKPWGEVDIVARKGDRVHFVEVKTVSAQSGIQPEDNVHERKMKRFSRAVQSYLAEYRVGEEWQIDAVLVRLDMENKAAKVAILEHVL